MDILRQLPAATALALLLGLGATRAEACGDISKDPTLSDTNSTTSLGTVIATTTPDPITDGGTGAVITSVTDCGFDVPGLIGANGGIVGDFHYNFTWPNGDCAEAKIIVRIENANGSSTYDISPTPNGSVSSPTGSMSITCSGSLPGLKAALPSSTKLSDLWVRAYWKCTSPNGPMAKIFEAKFKKS